MTINVELLKTTLAHIEAHPEEWHQTWYRCGSGMCFAGWAAQLAGGKWAAAATHTYSDYLVSEPDDPANHVHELSIGHTVRLVVDVAIRARRLLGLNGEQADDLFYADNTLDDLRTIVSELCEGAA